MGDGFLHQSNAAGRVGAIPAGSESSSGGEVGVFPPNDWLECRAGSHGFAMMRSLARYPSGPRERSAKPPFVGSNPTRASNIPKHLAHDWLGPCCVHRSGNCSECLLLQTNVLNLGHGTKYVTIFCSCINLDPCDEAVPVG